MTLLVALFIVIVCICYKYNQEMGRSWCL